MRTFSRLLVPALAGMVGAGCDAAPDVRADASVSAAFDPADPGVARFPPARLPITLPPQYVQHGRRLFHRGATDPGTTYELKTPLIEVVALEDLVVVIDGPGLRLSWAGADNPTWRSMSLEGALRGADLLTLDVADLDAVASTDFLEVHLVVRDTAGNIVHATWRPDRRAGGEAPTGSVTAARNIRPAPTDPGREPSWHSDQCEDLALAFSPEGDLNLAFLGGSLRKPRGALAWSAGVFRAPFRYCHQKITFDDSGIGLLAGVFRPEALFADDPGGPSQVRMPEAEQNFVGVVRAGNLPGAPGGVEQMPDPANTGRIVLDRHPDGFALLGMANASNFGSWLEPYSTRGLFQSRISGPSVPHPWTYECTGCGDSAWARESTGIIRNGCSTVTTFTARGGGNVPFFVEDPLILTSNTAPDHLESALGDGGFFCHTTEHAPVVWRPEAALETIYDIRFAHGRRPYNVGLCVSPEGAMSVCLGGFVGRFDTRDRPMGAVHDPAQVVTVVQSSIAHGGVFAADADEIVLTLSAFHKHLGVNFWDVTLGIKAGGVLETRPDLRQIVLRPGNRIANHTYRLEIYDTRLSAIAVRGTRQFFEFVAQGDAPAVVRPWPLACPEREGDVCVFRGVPIEPSQPRQTAPSLVLDLIGPESRRRGPSAANLLGVRDEADQQVAASAVLGVDGRLHLYFAEGLRPHTEYTLTLGPVIDAEGRAMRANDQTIRLITVGDAPPAAPTVVSTAPADGDTDVPVNATLTVVFDGPVDLATLPAAVQLSAEATPGEALPLEVIPHGDPSAGVTFSPVTPLAPHTNYRWTLGTGISGPEATGALPLAEAVVIRFTTGEAQVVVPVDPPTVVATTPTDGATEVPRGQALRVALSLPIDPATLAAGARLAPEAQPEATVALSAVPDGPDAARYLHGPLAADTRYRFTITTALASTAEAGGEPLAEDVIITFTTGAQ